ncbi:hypothetical protein KJ644_05410, partial [Candidatus Dependentiae bacterium]|nr:hypothetical protein [Candidatus Dependentiae bacterium]
NSNAIINLSLSNVLARQNSNAIVSQDLRITTNANNIKTNSNAIVTQDKRIRYNSSAIATHDGEIVNNSNAIINLSLSNVLARQNSNAIVQHDKEIGWNSNAIIAHDKKINYISSATINNNKLISYNSAAIIMHDYEITNNSNAIVSLNSKIGGGKEYLLEFMAGPGDIYFDSDMTLSVDLFLSDNHRLLIYNDIVIDGSNHFIDFAYSTSGLLYIDNNCTVTLKNIDLRNMHNYSINRGTGAKLYFTSGSSLNFEYKYILNQEWYFDGDVILDGNVNDIQSYPAGKLIFMNGSNITLQNIKFLDLTTDNFVFNDNVSVIFRDIDFNLGQDLNLYKGSYTFEGDVNITGTHKFIYQSSLTSTIAKYSGLYLSVGTTLSIDPLNRTSNPFYFQDRTAFLSLDYANLHATRGGLNLLNGSIFVSGVSSISSESYFDFDLSATIDNGITFGNQLEENDFYCNLYPSSMLDVASGSLNYKNISTNSWILNKQYAPNIFLNISANAALNLYESLNLGNGILICYDGTKIFKQAGKDFIGSVNAYGTIEYGILGE